MVFWVNYAVCLKHGIFRRIFNEISPSAVGFHERNSALVRPVYLDESIFSWLLKMLLDWISFLFNLLSSNVEIFRCMFIKITTNILFYKSVSNLWYVCCDWEQKTFSIGIYILTFPSNFLYFGWQKIFFRQFIQVRQNNNIKIISVIFIVSPRFAVSCWNIDLKIFVGLKKIFCHPNKRN